MHRIPYLLLLIIIASCHSTFVTTNQHKRYELKHKKYSEKFEAGMEEKIDTSCVYYRYYEDPTINYKSHTYLRFFKDGQYACFYSSDGIVDVNNTAKASHVGYYITDTNRIKLETPTGNFNTSSYRVIWTFTISEDGALIEDKNLKRVFIKTKNYTLEPVHPDW